MGIYIPGMEMPTQAQTAVIFPNGYVALYDLKESFIGGCKAIFVPPHGRLGDLDALFLAMFKCTDGSIIGDKDIDGWPHEARYADIKRFIRQAPTIIPAEEE